MLAVNQFIWFPSYILGGPKKNVALLEVPL
jgi:hypothetical protein